MLLSAGATVTTDEDGWTPLHAAAASANPHRTIVRLLVAATLSAGDTALLDARTKNDRNTALHLAVSNDKAYSPGRSATTLHWRRFDFQ